MFHLQLHNGDRRQSIDHHASVCIKLNVAGCPRCTAMCTVMNPFSLALASRVLVPCCSLEDCGPSTWHLAITGIYMAALQSYETLQRSSVRSRGVERDNSAVQSCMCKSAPERSTGLLPGLRSASLEPQKSSYKFRLIYTRNLASFTSPIHPPTFSPTTKNRNPPSKDLPKCSRHKISLAPSRSIHQRAS